MVEIMSFLCNLKQAEATPAPISEATPPEETNWNHSDTPV